MKDDGILVKTYTFDNKDYVVVNEIDFNNNHYYYLSNYNKPGDVMLKKLVNGYLEPLDDDNEIIEVLKTIAK